MSCGRAILCIIFPPLAVFDRGCGTVLIVLALTAFGWIPGAIAALYLNSQAETQSQVQRSRKRKGDKFDWD